MIASNDALMDEAFFKDEGTGAKGTNADTPTVNKEPQMEVTQCK